MTRSQPTAPSSVDLQSLLGDALPAVMADCHRIIGSIIHLDPAVGGNVSHVFRIRGDRGNAILKIRSDRFARIPELSTDPGLIADEHRALQLYGRLLPTVFPQVLGFHRHAHAMLLTDVFPDGRNYHQRLDTRPATATEMTRLGATLRRIHDTTRTIATRIRSQGDLWFRDHTFDFCLRVTGHPALTHACAAMAERTDQQLVLGDLAPKNFSLASDSVAICDLDNVHRNWSGYDLAYVVAHLLIHHLRWPDRLPALVHALLASYQTPTVAASIAAADQELLALVTAGVVLYRLGTSIVPYPLAGPPALADQYRRRVLDLLDTGTCSLLNLMRVAGVER